MKKLGLFLLVMIFVSGALFAQGAQDTVVAADEGPFRIAFVYIGPPGDMGWTYKSSTSKALKRVRTARELCVSTLSRGMMLSSQHLSDTWTTCMK